MGSNSPKTVFVESDLTQLEWVFDAVCQAVEARGLGGDATKAVLRHRLFLLARNGMDDPQKLRDYLLDSIIPADDTSVAQ